MKLFFGRLPVTACAMQALQRRGLLIAGTGLLAAGEVLPAALFDRSDLSGVIGTGRSYFALFKKLDVIVTKLLADPKFQVRTKLNFTPP